MRLDNNDFSDQLIQWFNINQRDLPWRRNRSWYTTFLSEYLLQQTQVNQASPYFEKFYNQFPDLTSLANTSEEEILRLWAGLGYYSRGRNLLKAARLIRDKFQGTFPENINDALSLPGIGPYTASAILSLAFNQSYPVLDGNVLRVASRVFNIKENIRLPRTKTKISKLLNPIIDTKQPGLFNEALMELGATRCKPQKPICQTCPVQEFCEASRLNITDKRPVRTPLQKIKQRKQLIFVIQNSDRLLLLKRQNNGLLASMWEFPGTYVNRLSFKQDEIISILFTQYAIRARVLNKPVKMKHTYSHFHLLYQPVILDYLDGNLRLGDYVDSRWLAIEKMKQYPVHNAHKKIIDLYQGSKI